MDVFGAVLLVGGLINAATGSVGHFMMMTNNQHLALRIYAATFLVGSLSAMALIPMLGITGAALSACVSVALVNVIQVVIVRSKLGIDTSALGRRPMSRTT